MKSMRDYLQIMEPTSTEPTGSREDIEDVFVKDFWQRVSSTDSCEIWKHMDDPNIGEYHVNLEHGEIANVEFIYPQLPMMNRKFVDFGEFAKHVSDITNDPIDPVVMLQAQARLAGIADQLRQNKK